MKNEHTMAPRNRPSGESLASTLVLWEVMGRDESSLKTNDGRSSRIKHPAQRGHLSLRVQGRNLAYKLTVNTANHLSAASVFYSEKTKKDKVLVYLLH